jgi:eukaryotic-like serine/threonine-protein kinase
MRPCALGVTTTAPPPSTTGKAQLLRRAAAIARLRKPNLVRMLALPGGAGLVPVATDARRLSDFTFPSGTFRRFDLEQVVRLLLDVLAGLSALHEVVIDGERFVHGEVCPKHIYIDEHGTAKLVPLTASHLLSAAREISGYTAPELRAGRAFDLRADLFSVGVMLWEALAGERLFPDADADEHAIGSSATTPRKSLKRARVPWAQPLCAIAERATSPEPSARYASAVELSNAIAQAVDQHLSKVDVDSWQDEAPTPVFQPRLHLPVPRSATPPATALDVPRELHAPQPIEPEDEQPTAIAKRPRRLPAFVMGFTALAILAAGWGAHDRLLSPAATPQRRPMVAAGAAPSAARAPAVVAAPAPPTVPVTASPVAASVVASPAAAPSVTPAAAPSATPRTLAKPKAKPVARPAAKRSVVDKSDYGI